MQLIDYRITIFCWLTIIGIGAVGTRHVYSQTVIDIEGTNEDRHDLGELLRKNETRKIEKDGHQPCPTNDKNDCQAITDVLLLMDLTESMGSHSRLSTAQWAAYDVLDAVPLGTPTSVLALYDDAEEVRPLEPLDGEGRSLLHRRILKFTPSGEGQLARLVALARQKLTSKADCARPLIVIITDGQDCDPYGAFRDVGELFDQYGERLQIHILGINTSSTARAELGELAGTARTRGHYFSVKTSEELSTALTGIRQHLDTINCARRAEIDSIRQTLIVIKTEMHTLKHEWVLLCEKSAKSEKTIIVQLKKIRELQSTINELTLKVERLKAECDRLKNSARNRQSRINKLTAQIDELKSELNEKNVLLIQHKMELQEFESRVSRLSAENAALNETVLGQRQELDSVNRAGFLLQCGVWILSSMVCALLTALGFMIYRMGESSRLHRDVFRKGTGDRLDDMVHSLSRGTQTTENGEKTTQDETNQSATRNSDRNSTSDSGSQGKSLPSGVDKKTDDKHDERQPSDKNVVTPDEPSHQVKITTTDDNESIRKDYRVGQKIVENYQNKSYSIIDVNYFAAAHRRVADAYLQLHDFELPPFGNLSEFDRLWSIKIDPLETWLRLDGRYRGIGSVGAMASIGKADVVENEAIWSGKLFPGAVVQTWKRIRDYELARDGIRANDSGYSFIFLEYARTGDQITGMRIADEMSQGNRVLNRDEYEYWVAGNLHQ